MKYPIHNFVIFIFNHSLSYLSLHFSLLPSLTSSGYYRCQYISYDRGGPSLYGPSLQNSTYIRLIAETEKRKVNSSFKSSALTVCWKHFDKHKLNFIIIQIQKAFPMVKNKLFSKSKFERFFFTEGQKNFRTISWIYGTRSRRLRSRKVESISHRIYNRTVSYYYLFTAFLN